MSAIAILRRAASALILLAALGLLAGLVGAPSAGAQRYTGYRRVKLETCLTDPNTDICKVYTKREPQANGYVRLSGNQGVNGIECYWDIDPQGYDVWLDCPDQHAYPPKGSPYSDGHSEHVGWNGPSYEWVGTLKNGRLLVSHEGERRTSAYFWSNPPGVIQILETRGCNAFAPGSCQLSFADGNKVAYGDFDIIPVNDLPGFDLGLYIQAEYIPGGQVMWRGALQFIWHYEAIPSASSSSVSNPPVPSSSSSRSSSNPPVVSSSSSASSVPSSGNNPWETAVGQACFERWITLAMSRLNSYKGDESFEAYKPFSINQYGILEWRYRRSSGAPDNFRDHNYNKYWYMWNEWGPTGWDCVDKNGNWSSGTICSNFGKANIPKLRDYVPSCIAESGPPGNSGPSGPGASTGTGATNTTLTRPPFGSPEPNQNTPGMTIQAGQRQVAPNQIVSVPVYLIKPTDVANINFDLTYDARVARPEGTITKGSLLDAAFLSVNPNNSGVIRIAYSQLPGVSSTGSLVYIPFRAVGKPGDRTDLTPIVTTINNPNGTTPAIDRILGMIEIVQDRARGNCTGHPGPLDASDALCALDMSTGLRQVDLVMDMDNSNNVTSRDSTIILQGIMARVGQ